MRTGRIWKKSAGLRLSVMNAAMIAVALVISAALIYVTVRTVEDYGDLRLATERYITCQHEAQNFQAGSDYLTNECRYFALTGDPEHAANFAQEVELTRRRENAVEAFDSLLREANFQEYLNEALRSSNALMDVECYAIRLAADIWGVAPEQLPDRVAKLTLKPEDAALSLEEKRAAVVDMLFGSDYQAGKEAIYENIDKSINALIENTRAQHMASIDQLSSMLRSQCLLVGLMLVALFAMVAGTYRLVIKPLAVAVRCIRANQEIPVTGSQEMRFMASTYNDMVEQHTHHTEQLTYSATHDALTGLYNRAAYESFRARLNEQDVAVLAVDVDEFKSFNDTYGHDLGDAVLKRVAKVLQDSFRSDDFVSRIGGDEFCVVMKRVNSGLRGLVEDKVGRALERLSQPENNVPSISLSVGVAFGDRPNPEGDVFKDADTALYSVKRGGRGGCAIF